MSGLALHTMQDALGGLSAIGLITSWSNGYHRFYRADRDRFAGETSLATSSKYVPRSWGRIPIRLTPPETSRNSEPQEEFNKCQKKA
jgi:hypothetical protein